MKPAQNAPGASGTGGSTLSATRPDLNAAKQVSKRSGAYRLAPEKVTLIHVAKAKVGMADEVYRQMLREIGDVGSSTQLNARGFAAVMDRFKTLGFVNPNNREAPPLDDEARRTGMATTAQRRFVRGLWRQWHGSNDSKALRKWLQGRFHVADLRFATEPIARMAIEGLKVMVARKTASSTNRADRHPTEE